MQLNELKKEFKFTRELLSLVETLKNIAGAQYHVMEKEKFRFARFMEEFSGFFRMVDFLDVEHPLVQPSSGVLGMVVVTSDSGFMGGLNQGVIREAMAICGERPAEMLSLVVIGDKGAGVFSDLQRPFKFFPGITQHTIYEQAVDVKNFLVQEVCARRMGRVMVAYPRAISFTTQAIDVVNLLPCSDLFDRNAKSDTPAHWHSQGLLDDARRVIVESSFPDMVEYLSSVWVTSKLYEVFEDSKLAEFSSRAMHLEGSQQKVEKNFKALKHRCFKATHERIDKGMRESFSAKGGQRKRRRQQQEAA